MASNMTAPWTLQHAQLLQGQLGLVVRYQLTTQVCHRTILPKTTARKNYTLNKTKTLKTKIEKCEKVFVDFNVTGGGITGKMVMATFELFRSACAELFNDLPPTLGRCVNHKTFDKYQKALVQQTYLVKRDVNGVEVGFTLNLYPTNNKRLLNGKDVDQFMYKHLPKIHQIMIRSPAR